jgi:predicted nucleic acid-binding protein
VRRAILDTDTLSYYLENRPEVVSRAAAYLRQFDKLDFSVVTFYEVRRGLLHAGAVRKLERFEQFANRSNVWPLDQDAASDAAAICADLWRRGEPLEDADILIASIARSRGMVLVTNNTAHYQRIDGLDLDNWTLPPDATP